MKLGFLKKLFKNEEGSVVVIVAVMMTVFMGFSAIVIDAGFMYGQRRSLQNAADAGALAGALERDIGSSFVVVEKIAKDVVVQNRNIPRENIIVTPISSKGVRVEVSQVAPKIFAGFLANADSVVRASAEADVVGWKGDALPFVNIDDPYTIGGQIEAWENNQAGNFESIMQYDRPVINRKEDNWEEIAYFDVGYDTEGGIDLTQGNDADVTKVTEAIYNRVKNGTGVVYVFSLTNKVITEKKFSDGVDFYDEDKEKYMIPNKYTVSKTDLVLLKCTIEYFKPQGNEPSIVLKVLDTYSLVDGDIPEQYYMPGIGAVHLTK